MAEQFLPLLAKKIAGKGENLARSKILSDQLRRGLYLQELTPTQYALIVPHFWATYIHDGRGAVTGKPLLIWFRNPKDDPRLLNGNTPERLSQTRRLTSGEFKKWSTINREKISAYKKATGKRILTQGEMESLKLPMVVARVSPAPYKSSKIYPFFANDPGGGMFGFIDIVGTDAKADVSAYVKARLEKAGLLKVKKTVHVKV